MSQELYSEAILIREVEQTFLKLFSEGKLSGTVHTCVGQEFSALAFAGQLDPTTDFVFSNHRCHGHYISFTKDYYGLLAELLGKESGVCAGIGSSQHLCNKNFFSNGIQGGIVPVAAGFALAQKIKKNNSVGVVYIGDGTLGEGALYETMNIISKWEIPLLIVCENNFYAQSTRQQDTLAGNITDRANAFGIKTFNASTELGIDLMGEAKSAIDYVRSEVRPAFFQIDTYRLNAHSKGDDDRDTEEINKYIKRDPLNVFREKNESEYSEIFNKVSKNIEEALIKIEKDNVLSFESYCEDEKTNSNSTLSWRENKPLNKRQVEQLNIFFKDILGRDKHTLFIGEDVLSPYGGAFKVAKDLSHLYPEQVFTTPISELAITGISNGLALAGMKPYLEIMFGDFTALTMDQLINHASKFKHMFNKQVTCPIVVRTPMGGGRGYGPTHSQSLEKFLVGIDNVKVIAPNSMVDPKEVYESIHLELDPVVVIENKLDYGRKVGDMKIDNYISTLSQCRYPLMHLKPVDQQADLTLVTYGGSTFLAKNSISPLFYNTEHVAEVIALTQVHPFDENQFDYILECGRKSKKIIFLEEGSSFAALGSEFGAQLLEKLEGKVSFRRVGATAIPIPSIRDLEDKALPNINKLISTVMEMS